MAKVKRIMKVTEVIRTRRVVEIEIDEDQAGDYDLLFETAANFILSGNEDKPNNVRELDKEWDSEDLNDDSVEVYDMEGQYIRTFD